MTEFVEMNKERQVIATIPKEVPFTWSHSIEMFTLNVIYNALLLRWLQINHPQIILQIITTLVDLDVA